MSEVADVKILPGAKVKFRTGRKVWTVEKRTKYGFDLTDGSKRRGGRSEDLVVVCPAPAGMVEEFASGMIKLEDEVIRGADRWYGTASEWATPVLGWWPNEPSSVAFHVGTDREGQPWLFLESLGLEGRAALSRRVALELAADLLNLASQMK